MTENKMPEVAWFGYNSGWKSLDHKIDGYGTKYLRAEPVEYLLKQARDALVECRKYQIDTEIDLYAVPAITAIDKFLEGKQ